MDEFFQDQVDLYLQKHQYVQQEMRRPSFSLVKSNENMQTYKTKINSETNKNSIKNKNIKDFKDQYHAGEKNQDSRLGQNCSMQSKDKRQRNRMAAKQSRDRKKLYIQLMENQQRKLQTQLNQINQQLELTKEKIHKFCSQNKTIIGFASLSQLQAKLEKTLQGPSSPVMDQQTNIIIDSMNFRMGALGRERVQKQTQCYKQIVNLSLPALHRYLLWAATQQKHIFSPKQNWTKERNQFFCKLPESVKVPESAYDELNQIKKQISERKHLLVDLISKLWQTKGSIEGQIKKLQEEIDVMRQIITPYQAAKFVLFANHNKYRKQVNFFREQKPLQYPFDQSHPRKKAKKQKQ